jgi:hypothetical protein
MSIFSAIGHAFRTRRQRCRAWDPGDSEAAALASFFGRWLHQESLSRAKWLIYGLLAMILVPAAALGWVLWLPRNRVFPLANAVPGSRP